MEVWEQALQSSLDELQAAARPWQIEPAALTELRDVHFKGGFQGTVANSVDEWNKRKDRVLRMAKYAGALAALFADWKTGNPSTGKITIVHLLAAMAIVKPGCGQDSPANTTATASGGSPIVILGKPCHRTVISAEAKVLLREKMVEFEVN
jgi:hypothetical protein